MSQLVFPWCKKRKRVYRGSGQFRYAYVGYCYAVEMLGHGMEHYYDFIWWPTQTGTEYERTYKL